MAGTLSPCFVLQRKLMLRKRGQAATQTGLYLGYNQLSCLAYKAGAIRLEHAACSSSSHTALHTRVQKG